MGLRDTLEVRGLENGIRWLQNDNVHEKLVQMLLVAKSNHNLSHKSVSSALNVP